jgi:hypothetical protein
LYEGVIIKAELAQSLSFIGQALLLVLLLLLLLLL